MVNCPVCGLRMRVRLNIDAGECPDHGEIFGLTMVQIGKDRGWRAQIEVTAQQVMQEVRTMANDAIFGASYRHSQYGYALVMKKNCHLSVEILNG